MVICVSHSPYGVQGIIPWPPEAKPFGFSFGLCLNSGMTMRNRSGIMAALWVVGLWLAVSAAGVFLLGILPASVGRLAGMGPMVLALHLFFLTLITEKGVSAIATPFVPQWQRWAILLLGAGLVASSYLVVRQGVPGRTAWEALTTCGQILVVVVAAGYLPRFLKHPNEILPLVSVMVCADVVSFLVGPTHFIARDVADYYLSGREGIYPASEVLLMKFAAPGSFELFPLFGLADWFMVVFLSSGVRQFGLDDRVKGIPLAVLGLFLACASAQLLHLFLPALPVLALFFLLAMGFRHGKAFSPGQREILLTLFPPALSLIILILR